MPRRIIPTNLNGAIVFNGTISSHNRGAVTQWRVTGNLLVINTGGSVSALKHVVAPMGLKFDNTILYTGVVIADENIRVQCPTVLPAGIVEGILDFVEEAPDVTIFTAGPDEDLFIYDTIGSGSELLTLFRPATRCELDEREVIGVPMHSTDPKMAAHTETYLRRRWEGQAMGSRSRDFIDVVPASTSKEEGLRRLVARPVEPPAGETDGAAGEGTSGETPVGGSAGLDVGPRMAEPMETWSIGNSQNGISTHAATDHLHALSWSPSKVVAQCNGTVSNLADLIDSLMGRLTL